MTERQKILQKLVKQEAKNLREKATKKELNLLDFEKLDPVTPEGCIYGLMTGNCMTRRASKLIDSCCTRVYTRSNVALNLSKLNGPPTSCDRSKGFKNFDGSEDYNAVKYWSPIEVFIFNKRNQKNGNNKRLIDYLKGETKTLKFV